QFCSEKGLSQKQAAQIAGVTRATMGAIQEGRAMPKLPALIALATAYEMTLDDFLHMRWDLREDTTTKAVMEAYFRADPHTRAIVDCALHLEIQNSDE
ncbi:MAG: helix-turn-helix transcriptional regulator, partial [Chitinophagaceae bacterium]|nr:helix-turn-helix transcriptional regulator [Chitinophagaceae bacterium]